MENDTDKILQDVVYELKTLSSIVLLNFIVTVGIVCFALGAYWLSSK